MTTTSSVKVEFSLCEPIYRTKVNNLLFKILSDLNINEDFDLNTISYAIEKTSKLVYRLIIIFKSNEIADLFCNHIENEEKSRFTNIIKNVYENEEDLIKDNINSLSDSILILSPEDSYDVETNRMLCMETSYYNEDFKKSQFEIPLKNDMKKIYLHSSTSSLSNQNTELENLDSLKYDDFTVEFYSSKAIEPDDLEIILLFLENSKQSGGGDSSEHKLDSSKHLLTIKYEDSRPKQRLLEKKILTFQQYKLIANEPFDEKKFKLDERTIILKNVSDKMSKDAIQLFVENLVVNDQDENDAENIYASIFFRNIYFASFKMNYNKEKIFKRLNRKATFFGQTISILEAYTTKTILVSKVDRLGVPLIEEYVELYFTNKKRCGVDTYLSMRERHPFWLITFEDQVSVEKILANKHTISKQELMVERLINFEVLAEGIKNLENSVHKQEETTKLSDSNKSQNQSSVLETNNFEFQVNQVDINVSHVRIEDKDENKITQFERPTIVLKLENEPNIKILYLFDGEYFKQFTDELFDKEAAVIKINSDQPSIRIECSNFNPNDLNNFEKMRDNWFKDVNEYIRNFLNQFEIKLIQLENIDNIIKRLKFDQMRVQCVKVENGILLCGFKNLVKTLSEDIHSEFNKLQSNQNEIIEEKLTGFKLYQLRVLFVNRFIKQMRDKHENLVIKIDARNNLVYFKGTREQIKDANEHLDIIIKNIKTINIPADDLLIRLIENKEMDIVTWLKDKDILCTLEPDSNKNIIIVHSTEREQLERCRQAFCKEIIVNEVDASILSESCNEQEIIEFVESFDKEQGVIVSFSNSTIRICGFDDKVNEIYTKFIEKM